jgi:hypothetical protein
VWCRGWRRRDWRQRQGRLRLLLLVENLGQLVDVGLEELELLLARLAGGDNLHDGLELWVCASAGGQHVDDGVGGGRRGWAWGRLGRGLLDGLRGRRSWVWVWVLVLLVLLGAIGRLGVLVVGRGVLAMRAVLGLLAVVGPGAVVLRRGHLLRGGSRALARGVQLDGERVRLNDQLGVEGADLGEVLLNVLLAGAGLLVGVGALRHLLGHCVLLVEGAEVDPRHPHGPRPLQRGTEHAALLDVLPFRRGQVEGLRLGECGQRLAVDDAEGQRLSGSLCWWRSCCCCVVGVDGRAWCCWLVLDGDAGPLALQRRLCPLGRRVPGRLGGRGRSFFAGARPRRPSGLSHGG